MDDTVPDLVQEDPPTLTERQDAFLHLLREEGFSDRMAAEAVGYSRWAPMRWKKDPVFKARYDEARKSSIELLIKEAERRAVNGSDKLLMFLLCNKAPDQFRMAPKTEVNAHVNGTLVVSTGVPVDDGSDMV